MEIVLVRFLAWRVLKEFMLGSRFRHATLTISLLQQLYKCRLNMGLIIRVSTLG